MPTLVCILGLRSLILQSPLVSTFFFPLWAEQCQAHHWPQEMVTVSGLWQERETEFSDPWLPGGFAAHTCGRVLWELGALWRAHPSFVFLERSSCLIVWHVLKMLGVVNKFSVSSRSNWDHLICSRPTRGTWEDPTSKYHHHNHYYYYWNYCNKRRHHILFWLFGLRVLRQVMHNLFECMYTGMHICLSVYLCV